MTRGAGEPSIDALAGWRLFGITTQDRPERGAHLERELARTGMAWEMLRSERPSEAAGFDSIGTKGCFESHRSALCRALDVGAAVVVLVEDDAVLAPRFERKLSRAVHGLADVDWSILHVGYLGDSSPIRDAHIALSAHNVARAEGWEVRGAHCVAFRREIIPAVLENMRARLDPGGHRIPVDGVYNEFRRDAGEPTWICVPNLAHQGPSPSGITPIPSVRNRLLEHGAVRRAVELVKRCGWGASAAVPARVWVLVWNLRADIRDARRRPTDGTAAP